MEGYRKQSYLANVVWLISKILYSNKLTRVSINLSYTQGLDNDWRALVDHQGKICITQATAECLLAVAR